MKNNDDNRKIGSDPSLGSDSLRPGQRIPPKGAWIFVLVPVLTLGIALAWFWTQDGSEHLGTPGQEEAWLTPGEDTHIDLWVGAAAEDGSTELSALDPVAPHYGSYVRVRGVIEEILDNGVFIMRPQGVEATGDRYLVVYNDEDIIGDMPMEGLVASVQGLLVQFEMTEINSHLQDAELQELTAFEGTAAILATPLAH